MAAASSPIRCRGPWPVRSELPARRPGASRPARRGSAGARSSPPSWWPSVSRDGIARPCVHRRWWRWLQAILGLLVVFFVARYLVRNWDEVRLARLDLTLRPGWIILSLLLVLATYA